MDSSKKIVIFKKKIVIISYFLRFLGQKISIQVGRWLLFFQVIAQTLKPESMTHNEFTNGFQNEISQALNLCYAVFR